MTILSVLNIVISNWSVNKMTESRQILQDMKGSPVMEIHRKATSDMKKWLDENHEFEPPPEGRGVDLFISSMFANSGGRGEYQTMEMVKILRPWFDSMYWKYQKAVIQEEIESGLRNKHGDLLNDNRSNQSPKGYNEALGV